MKNNKLKAYIVTDNYFLDEYALVFAESADKAKSTAFSSSDLFWDNQYIDLRANRAPKLDKFVGDFDKAYCIKGYWDNLEIRRELMTSYNFFCTLLDPKECIYCKCNDICEKWEEYLLEHKVEEEVKIN